MSSRRSTRARRPVKSIYDDARTEQAAAIVETSAGFKNKKKMRTKEIPMLDSPMYNLPDAVLIHISSFVNDTSKVLLAVALTASSDAIRKSNYDIKPCPGAKAILNQRVRRFRGPMTRVLSRYKIDFADVDKELAARLSDEDVGGILAFIDSVFGIKTVKLTHCVNITGRCLEPLRGSTILKEIDLSLVDKDSDCLPITHPESKIAEADVIPILDSIIEADGFSLMHIQFPKRWREEQSRMMRRFLSKYNRIMNDEEIRCENCNRNCSGSAGRPWISKKRDEFGIYNYTCYTCKKSFCRECAEEMEMDHKPCENCGTRQCRDCRGASFCNALECEYCHETSCRDCTGIFKCDRCGEATCYDCRPVHFCNYYGGCDAAHCESCVPFLDCDFPDCDDLYNANCAECSDRDHCCVKCCPNCEITYCGTHLMKSVLKNSQEYCLDCKSRAALNLSDYNQTFGWWVQGLEFKYSVKGRDCWSSAGDDLLHAIEAREELHQRCIVLGTIMTTEQKRCERFNKRLASWISQRGDGSTT